MKKLTFLALVMLAMNPSLTNAEMTTMDGKLKINAEARVRYEFFNNTDFVSGTNDKNDFIFTRVRPKFTLTPHEQLTVVFEPQFSAGWGEVLNTSVSSVNSATGGTTSGGLNDPTLGVHQGYFTYAPNSVISLTLGRQEIAYGDELVIGSVGWHNTGRSFDALKLKFKKDRYWVDAIYSLLSDQESAAGRGACAAPCNFGDHHFGGLYGSINAAEWLKEFDLYAFYRYDDASNPRPHNYLTFGTRLKGKKSAFDYRFEATGQYGKSTVANGGNYNQRDYQADLEVGYNFENFYNFRFGLEGLLASENYIQMFPTAHKWIGYVDLFGRRNIMGGVVHLSIKPNDKWFAKLDAHTLFRYTTDRGLFRLNGTTEIGAAGTSNSRLAGEEIDFVVSYKPLKMLSFDAGINGFIPMGFVKGNVGDDIALFGFLQSKLKF